MLEAPRGGAVLNRMSCAPCTVEAWVAPVLQRSKCRRIFETRAGFILTVVESARKRE
jgi:hypothetical protein